MSARTPARLAVVHDTRYDYSARVDVAHHLACLRPRAFAAQAVSACELQIEPAPNRRSGHEDAFGNLRDYFAFSQPHDALQLRMHGEVLLAERRLDHALADATPWEAVRDSMRYRAEGPWVAASEFAFASPFVPVEPELCAYAAQDFTPGRPLVDAALALAQRMHAEFAFDPRSTEVGTPALEAFRARRGVCQDFSHIMIGCLRSLGLAARYVSGYLLTRPPPGKPRLVGADATHAWVEAWCPANGWLALDPTNDVLADLDHVTVAWGRDYADVAPLRGVIRGGGQVMPRVAVTVEPLGGD